MSLKKLYKKTISLFISTTEDNFLTFYKIVANLVLF